MGGLYTNLGQKWNLHLLFYTNLALKLTVETGECPKFQAYKNTRASHFSHIGVRCCLKMFLSGEYTCRYIIRGCIGERAYLFLLFYLVLKKASRNKMEFDQPEIREGGLPCTKTFFSIILLP